ncbi:hypothetical protein M0R45_009221 [Rubus argutus]|uniref:Uncharacterized protein n=1 Tax=Rubus argutus TaxID=59490 RepID=A0AAW1Y6V8_RUBAR
MMAGAARPWVLLRAGLCGIDDGDGAVWRRWELGFAWCRQRWVLELKRAAAVVVSWRFGVWLRTGQRRGEDAWWRIWVVGCEIGAEEVVLIVKSHGLGMVVYAGGAAMV